MDSAETIKEALEDLQERLPRYAKLQRYYDGRHDLAFATDKFRTAFGSLFKTFADNLMPPVVNGFADNLRVEDFTVESGDTAESDRAYLVWQRNFMEQRSAELHRELIKSGDAYVIVWQNSAGEAVIYPNKARNVTVRYDAEDSGRILWAVKVWKVSKKETRLNLYLPDRVEKFRAVTDSESSGYPAANLFKMFETVENPFGRVPVFHFAINADIGEFGTSELVNLIPLNDALNKCLCDMLVAMEFGAFRQRWATGIEIHTDEQGKPVSPFTAGASGIWTSDNENARFGDFQTSDIEQYVKVQESIRAEIARVASLPLHYLMLHAGNLASGRALQTAERRFQGKLKSLQTVIGAHWAEVVAFALEIGGESKKSVRFFTKWEDTSSISELEQIQLLQAKKAIGVSTRQLLREAGYGAEDILRIETEISREQTRKDPKKDGK